MAHSSALTYKGFSIMARTFQLRGSGRWTLDLLIGRRGSLRAFSRPVTYRSEQAAVLGCRRLAERIIDGRVGDCRVDDLF
jgi:hypothetical protein